MNAKELGFKTHTARKETFSAGDKVQHHSGMRLVLTEDLGGGYFKALGWPSHAGKPYQVADVALRKLDKPKSRAQLN